MRAKIVLSWVLVIALVAVLAFFGGRFMGASSIEEDVVRDDQALPSKPDEASKEEGRDQMLASDFVGDSEAVLDSSAGHAAFNESQVDDHPILAQHRVLENAVLEYFSFEEFFSENKTEGGKASPVINAAEWMGVLCEQVIQSVELDDDMHFYIRDNPYRLYFFMRLIDFCLGKNDNWDEVVAQIGQASFSPNREIDAASSYWFDFMVQFGRTALLQELARTIETTHSLADMIAAMRMLGVAGYLYSEEVGLGVPQGAYNSHEFVPAYEVSMLYFCQYAGGCGRYHPFTMDFCIRNACDEQVVDYFSAIHRSTPLYRKELLAVHYQVLLRLRREGPDGLNIDPDYDFPFGR